MAHRFRCLVVSTLTLSALAGASACHDDSMTTQPTPPLDVTGTWHGGVTSERLRTPCATPEPASVTATFTRNGTLVSGAFSGACLDGATFEGHVLDQSLRGATTFSRGFCPNAAPTGGPGSASRLRLDIDVRYPTEFTGCSGALIASGTLRLDLTR